MSDITNDYIKQVDVKNATHLEFMCDQCRSPLGVRPHYLHGSILMNVVEPCPVCTKPSKLRVTITGEPTTVKGVGPDQTIVDDHWS